MPVSLMELKSCCFTSLVFCMQLTRQHFIRLHNDATRKTTTTCHTAWLLIDIQCKCIIPIACRQMSSKYTSLFAKMVAHKKIQTYKQKKQYKNTLITHYVHSQSIAILTKCIDRIFIFTNKFLTSFFDI